MATRHDDLHSMSARQVALRRKYATCQQEYQQVLRERQQPAPERHTDALPRIKITDYTSSPTYRYKYVDALTERVHLHEEQAQAIRERAERMRQTNAQTQERIARMLGRIDPQLETQSTDIRALTIYGQQEHAIIHPIGSMTALLDSIVLLYIDRYSTPQKSIKMSFHNHLLFSLERQGYAESFTTYSNQYGTFQIVPDANLDDQTIISD